MKKLITIVGLSLSLMAIGITVNANCDSGSLATGEPGTCTPGEPTYEFYTISKGPGGSITFPVQVEGEYWCDLNTPGSSCYVLLIPE